MARMKTSITPGVLIAAPQLYDPNFDRTVVLMCDHSEEGAMGLVINRPSPISMENVFQGLNLEAPPGVAPPVLVGGPVQPERGWLIHSSPTKEGESIEVAECIYISTSRSVLEAVQRGIGPSPYRLALGYSGWGPGQLETEIAAGAWIIGKAYPALVFDVPIEKKWEQALADLGIDPAQLADTVGEA